MSMQNVEGVIFDKDGTLFDFSSSWEAWALAFLKRLARDETHARALAECVGFEYEKQIFRPSSIVIAGTPSEIAEAISAALPERNMDEIIGVLNAEAARAPQAEAVPLKPLLAKLRAAGLKLGVATNDAEMPALAHLDGADIREAFDFIAGFDSGYGGKPAPGQLLGFCKVLDLAPESVIMVGDSLHDLRAGKAAGMRCVGVLTGMATEADLSPFADNVLPDIGHLPAFLGLK